MDRNMVKRRFLPLNSSLEKANAARVMTITIMAVVTTVKINVLRRYLPRDTCENALVKFSKVGSVT